jgi:hypothetical protein
VFQPIHWGDEWARGASPNEATTDVGDAVSRQPALKACAVAVRPYAPAPEVPANVGQALHPANIVVQAFQPARSPEAAPVSGSGHLATPVP